MIASYDIVMLVVLVGTTMFGVWKGAAWQIAALASVLLSAAVSVHSSAALAPYFGADERWNRFVAILVIYVVTSAAIWLLFRLVSGIIDRVQLKEFDRQLGGMLGLAKGALYCVIITFFAVTVFASFAREAVLQSRSGDLIARGIRNANPILPDDVRAWLGEYIDKLDRELTSGSKETAVPNDGSATNNGSASQDGTAPKENPLLKAGSLLKEGLLSPRHGTAPSAPVQSRGAAPQPKPAATK